MKSSGNSLMPFARLKQEPLHLQSLSYHNIPDPHSSFLRPQVALTSVYVCRLRRQGIIGMPHKRKRPNQANTGSDTEDELTVKQAATFVGFYDPGIDPKLYQFWRAQVHRGIQHWNGFGAGETGSGRWSEFCEWAAS